MYQYVRHSCPRCGEGFTARETDEPLRYAEREAYRFGPKWLVVIGGDRVIHTCAVTSVDTPARRATR
jgi:hypothetical protein